MEYQKDIVVTGVKTVTGNSGVLDIDYGHYDSLIIQLAVSAASGTNPTLDVIVEDTLNGVNFYTIATFAQKIGTAVEIKRIAETAPFADKLRVSWVIAGTTPSFTLEVKVMAK